jgi:hypothetical protein
MSLANLEMTSKSTENIKPVEGLVRRATITTTIRR